VEEDKMSSDDIDENSFQTQVINVCPHGFWLGFRAKAYFMDFDRYPRFRDATVEQIRAVELLDDDHLFWPELDVLLDVQSITQPGRLPPNGED
jgi:hypothetical protein